jgi:UDP-glucose 4-epimerase
MRMPGHRVLVLGGSGFIGSHVVDALLVAGHSVRVFDQRPERFRAPPAGVDTILGRFSDTATLIEALARIETVVHLISSTTPGTADLDPAADVSDNLLATLGLLALMERQGIRRIVYMSSGGTVYGVPDVLPVPESHPLRPISSYGIVKASIEHYLRLYARRSLVPVVIRAANPYRPRQGHAGVQGVIATAMRRVLQGDAVEVWGDGSVVRDYLHVKDLARLCVLAVSTDAACTVNAGSGTGTSLLDLIGLLGQVTGRAVIPRFMPGRAVDVPVSVLDVGQARRIFGWQVEIPLAEGLAETWASVRAEGQ